MKRMKGFRSLLALTLAFAMLMSSAGSTLAFAEGNPVVSPIQVKDGIVEVWDEEYYESYYDKFVENEELTSSGVLNNSIVIDEEYIPGSALLIESLEEDSAFTVDGNVEVNSGSCYDAVWAVSLNNTASAVVTGDIIVDLENEGDYVSIRESGAYADVVNEQQDESENGAVVADAVVTVGGNVEVIGKGTIVYDDEEAGFVDATGVYARSELETGSATVNVGDMDEESADKEPAALSGNVSAETTFVLKEYAYGDTAAVAIQTGGVGSQTISITGSATAEATISGGLGEVYAAGISIYQGYYETGGSNSITVGKDVSSSAKLTDGNGKATAYGIDISADAVNTVVVNGNVSATGTVVDGNGNVTSKAYGINTNGVGQNTVTVKGNVSTDSNRYSEGVHAFSNAVDSTTEIHVAGDVTAKTSNEEGAGEAFAVIAESGNWEEKESGHVIVTVDGKAVATVATDNIVASKYAVEAESHGEGSWTEVTIGKGAEGTVSADAYNGGRTDVEILDGGVITEGRDSAIVLYDKNANINATVNGDVEAKGGNAIKATVWGGKAAETNLTVNGDVSSQNSNLAKVLSVSVHDQGTLNATISGESVSAEGDTYARGVNVENHGGNANIQINAAVTATGDYATGLHVTSYQGGSARYSVAEDAEPVDVSGMTRDETDDGEIQIDGKTYMVHCFEDPEDDQLWWYYVLIDGEYYLYDMEFLYDEGASNIAVTGDVSGTAYGASLGIAEEQTASIIVDGTLSGGEAAVALRSEDSVVGENVELAVWKLETDSEEENAVLIVDLVIDDEGEVTSSVQNEKAESAVQYIVKVMEKWAGKLMAVGTNKVTAGKGENAVEYQTAKQDDSVTLKITLSKDEEFEGVYYDDEAETNNDVMTVENKGIEKDSDGNFLVKMLRGGGMLLGLKTKPHKHTMQAFAANDATCTEDGNIAYWYCPDCGRYYSDAEGKTEIKLEDTVIKAGHKLTAVAAKDPTCTEEGNIAYWYCSVCKKYFSDADGKNEIKLEDTILEATGHKLTAVAAKEPTCTEDGNIAYWYCEKCKKYFGDAEGKTEIKLEDTIIKAGHKLTEVKEKKATCTEDGNIAYWYCSVCDKYFSDAEGKNEIKKEDTIIKAGHKLTAVAAKDATETEDGNIAYWYCAECGKYFSDAEGKTEIKKEDTVVKAKGGEAKSDTEREEEKPVPVNPVIEQENYPEQEDYILKIKDKSGEAEITFWRNGTYLLEAGPAPDGFERGTFELVNGQIVLTTERNEKRTIDQVENGWKLTFAFGKWEYVFELSAANIETLTDAVK